MALCDSGYSELWWIYVFAKDQGCVVFSPTPDEVAASQWLQGKKYRFWISEGA